MKGKVKNMIQPSDINAFKSKLYDSIDEYCEKIDHLAYKNDEISFSDQLTIKIWSDRIDSMYKMITELDLLKFDLFV